ncbi:isoaspartyl peptidase/L-asparaginase [Candidatus Woesearchaeota archaeon]|nr:isoaspartyl peptidase/L-asparaginase [Candidatus Woesearchaeota archaeon]
MIIHGGVGHWDRYADKKGPLLQEYANAGRVAYTSTKDPIQSVLAAIQSMEKDALFNAGYGSAINAEGEVECDASIMVWSKDGIRTGAVSGLKGILHPILTAFYVMDKTGHVLLTGQGAQKFAKLCGQDIVDLRSEARLAEWKKYSDMILAGEKTPYDQEFLMSIVKNRVGTVGAVATDGKIIVAGTSTGGIPMKLPGRVGDSAIIGAGTLATKHVGVSCTGTGEYCIALRAASRIEHYLQTMELEAAVERVVQDVTENYEPDSLGIITLRLDGTYASKHNSDGFVVGLADEDSVRFLQL